jgi:DnaK suppressor protein
MSWDRPIVGRKHVDRTPAKQAKPWDPSWTTHTRQVPGARRMRGRDERLERGADPAGATIDNRAGRMRDEPVAESECRRRALLALKSRLQGEVVNTADTALSGCGIESTCGSPDPADRANEIVEQDVVLGLLGSVNGSLEEIDAALGRIEDGSYGCCLDCGAKIPAVRLEALPYASCCVQCASRRERVA